ncbi:hypothetical protein Nepgr_000069 [Nepenthes gracilis]|uniref:Very-long-chain (3R)-3-hydroxyacyl-CoA dehydratase n=1 Tax=Nepenthes gracilis TaxID=150966 RepID=A0AAD3P1G7_NEPGR|nr:hypothetical protein Nepgr_000069 [Nepenthes gracilis]
MPRLSSFYLFTYNSLQAFGWAISLYRILVSLALTNSLNTAYASAGDSVCLLQTISFLEVIHGALGIVRTGVLLPLMQWGGRIHFLLAIVRGIGEVQDSPLVFVIFAAWSLSEVIRYSHYALTCIGKCPYWVTSLRYTAFIFLYPVGVAGEMWLMYHALPRMKLKNLYADYFAFLPFSYYNFIEVLLVVYPILWLKLYLHLLKQRHSKLGKQHDKKNK